jgi:hypothetical protein
MYQLIIISIAFTGDRIGSDINSSTNDIASPKSVPFTLVPLRRSGCKVQENVDFRVRPSTSEDNANRNREPPGPPTSKLGDALISPKITRRKLSDGVVQDSKEVPPIERNVYASPTTPKIFRKSLPSASADRSVSHSEEISSSPTAMFARSKLPLIAPDMAADSKKDGDTSNGKIFNRGIAAIPRNGFNSPSNDSKILDAPSKMSTPPPSRRHKNLPSDFKRLAF